MATHLIVLDSASLVALASINALDLLNDVTDKVSVSQAARATAAIDAGMGLWIWMDRRADCEDGRFSVISSNAGEMAEMAIRSGSRISEELASGYNRLNAMEILNQMEDMFPEGEDLIILSDDPGPKKHWGIARPYSIARTMDISKHALCPEFRHVSTRGLLDAMERAGMIPSADHVVDLIEKAGITLADDPEGREPLVLQDDSPRP